MSIDARKFKSKYAQRDANAQYFTASMGGSWEDWMDQSKPRFRIYNDIQLQQMGFTCAETYSYKVPNGNELYQVLRYEHKEVPQVKRFAMRRGTTDYLVDAWFADAGEVKIIYCWPEVAASKASEIVYVCEGEKDADRLHELKLIATTVAGQHWSDTAAEALRGRDVVILEDNDEAGRNNAIESAERLQPHARSIKIVKLPGLGEGEDVSDWLDAGQSVRALKKIVSETPLWGNATPLPEIEPKKIPRRQWLSKPYYIRQFVSLTIAPGGTSKSALLIAEALAMATGKDLLGVGLRRPLRVMYWNGEDSLEELYRRFAATMKHYGIAHAEIGNRLFVKSGMNNPIVIAEDAGRRARLNDGAIRRLRDTILRDQIDVLILDPFVSLHSVEENNNSGIDRVAKALTRVAVETNCAIMLAHHSRKGGTSEVGKTTTVEDGRGAIALRDAVRSARALNKMTTKEAEKAEIEEWRRGYYFRADNGKANLTPPAEVADWYEMKSIDLENHGPDADWDEGDRVGVVVPWSFPEPEPIAKTQRDIGTAITAVRAGGPWRRDLRSKVEPWVGKPIGEALGVDPENRATRAQLVRLIQSWITAGYLKVVIGKRPRGRRTEEHEYVEAGKVPEMEKPGTVAGDTSYTRPCAPRAA